MSLESLIVTHNGKDFKDSKDFKDFKISNEPLAVRSWVNGRMVFLELADKQIFSFPADRFSRLRHATDEKLRGVRLELGGFALRWEALYEDITVPGILHGHWRV